MTLEPQRKPSRVSLRLIDGRSHWCWLTSMTHSHPWVTQQWRGTTLSDPKKLIESVQTLTQWTVKSSSRQSFHKSPAVIICFEVLNSRICPKLGYLVILLRREGSVDCNPSIPSSRQIGQPSPMGYCECKDACIIWPRIVFRDSARLELSQCSTILEKLAVCKWQTTQWLVL